MLKTISLSASYEDPLLKAFKSELIKQLSPYENAPFLIRYYIFCKTTCESLASIGSPIGLVMIQDPETGKASLAFDPIIPKARQYDVRGLAMRYLTDASQTIAQNIPTIRTEKQLTFLAHEILVPIGEEFEKVKALNTLFSTADSQFAYRNAYFLNLFTFQDTFPCLFSTPLPFSSQNHFLIFYDVPPSALAKPNLLQNKPLLSSILHEIKDAFLSTFNPMSSENQFLLKLPLYTTWNIIPNSSVDDCSEYFKEFFRCTFSPRLPYSLIPQTERDLTTTTTRMDRENNYLTSFCNLTSKCFNGLNELTRISNYFPCYTPPSIEVAPIALHSGKFFRDPTGILCQYIPDFNSEHKAVDPELLCATLAGIVRDGVYESPEKISAIVNRASHLFFAYNAHNHYKPEGVVSIDIWNTVDHRGNPKKVADLTAAIFTKALQEHTRGLASFLLVLAGKIELSKNYENSETNTEIITSYTTLENRVMGTAYSNFNVWPKLKTLPWLQCYKLLHMSMQMESDDVSDIFKHSASLQLFNAALDSLHSYFHHISEVTDELSRAIDHMSSLINKLKNSSTDLHPITKPLSKNLRNLAIIILLRENLVDTSVHSIEHHETSVLLNKVGELILQERSAEICTLWRNIFIHTKKRNPTFHEEVLMQATDHYPIDYSTSKLHHNEQVNALMTLLDPGAACFPILIFNNRSNCATVWYQLLKMTGLGACC